VSSPDLVTRMEETRRKATQSVESGPDPTSLYLVSQPAIGLQKNSKEGLFRQADLKAAAPTLRTNRVVPLNYRLKPCGNGSSGAMNNWLYPVTHPPRPDNDGRNVTWSLFTKRSSSRPVKDVPNKLRWTNSSPSLKLPFAYSTANRAQVPVPPGERSTVPAFHVVGSDRLGC